MQGPLLFFKRRETKLKIQVFTCGYVGTNTYVLYDYDGLKALVIDSPDGNGEVVRFLEKNNLKPEAVLLTHGHFDHVMGLLTIRDSFRDIPIYISKEDKYLLDNRGEGNKELLKASFPGMVGMLSQMLDTIPRVISTYEDGKEYYGFKVIPTPGHTPGGVGLYNEKEKILFSGDTIFQNSYGRTDFPGSDFKAMIASLRKLTELPEETIVLPGHGPHTTIGAEKQNPLY